VNWFPVLAPTEIIPLSEQLVCVNELVITDRSLVVFSRSFVVPCSPLCL